MESDLRIYSVFGLKIIFIKGDWMMDANDEEVQISEEWGWWDEVAIYVWDGLESWLVKFGVIVHEMVERFLVLRLKMNSELAHRIANVVEKILTFGRAQLFWR